MEPVELLTGDLSVAREHSEGISLEAFADSAGLYITVLEIAMTWVIVLRSMSVGDICFHVTCDLQFSPHLHNT